MQVTIPIMAGVALLGCIVSLITGNYVAAMWAFSAFFNAIGWYLSDSPVRHYREQGRNGGQ